MATTILNSIFIISSAALLLEASKLEFDIRIFDKIKLIEVCHKFMLNMGF